MGENLYQLGYLSNTKKKITGEDIKNQSFFSVYDAQQSEKFSFGAGQHLRIMASYATKRDNDFKNKFGMTQDEYAAKANFQQMIFEEEKDFLKEMSEANTKFRKKSGQMRKTLADLAELKNSADQNQATLNQITKNLDSWRQVTQEYLDVMANVGDVFADSKGWTTSNISGQTPKGYYTSPSALTSYEKASLLLDKMDERMKAIGGDVQKLKKMNLTTPVVRKGKIVKNKKTKRTLNDTKSLNQRIRNSMTGYISSAKGIAFEIAVANALYKATGDIVDGVEMLGSASGVTFKDSKGGKIGNISTSKTDVAYKEKQGFMVNLSLKNQKKGSAKPIETKFLSSSLSRYLQLVTTNNVEAQLLVGGFATNREEFNNINSELNLFLAALVADMAIGSGGADKIDFIVFNNGIMGLGDYYREVSDSISLFTKNTTNKEEVIRILSGLESPMSVRGDIQVKASH